MQALAGIIINPFNSRDYIYTSFAEEPLIKPRVYKNQNHKRLTQTKLAFAGFVGNASAISSVTI